MMKKDASLDATDEQIIVGNGGALASKRPKYPYVIAGIALVFVVLGVFAATKLPSNNGVCSEQVIQNAAADFAPSRYAQLTKDVATIKAKQDYQTDPNCLYVVMEYSIHSTDYLAAKQTYTQLQTAYDPAKGFSDSFGTNKKSMEDFKQSLAYLKDKDAELLKNSFGIPQP